MLTGIEDALIIHNPVAGFAAGRRRFRDLEAAQRILADAGITTEVATTSGPGQAAALASAAVGERRGMVIGCGGDGTINEIANGMAGSQVPLAILPAGTANVLVKELGLPWNIPAAARRILTGRLERIALGLVHSESAKAGRYFVCVAGAGVDASIVFQTNLKLKQYTGTFAYWLEGLRHFVASPLVPFSAVADGRSFRATQVIIGRTRNYGGPFRITLGADLFSNRFQVAVFTSTNRFRYVAHLLAIWLSRLDRQRDVHLFHATHVRCEAFQGTEEYAEIDGELAGALPLEFSIVPDALTLVVPGGEPESGPQEEKMRR
jgi:YegS/Rv2252/BmrU family lipid kinase